MEYTIHPIQSLEAYKIYAASRCTYNRTFFPDQGPYFQNTYEIDYYDLFSRHYGISVKEEQHDRFIGFVRITQHLNENTFWKSPLAPEIKSFISHAWEDLQVNKPESALPSFQQFGDDHKDLHKSLQNKQGIAELGRLIILDKHSHPFLPLKLISYALAASIFHGIKYMLIRTSKKHGRFYNAYFNSFYLADLTKKGSFYPSVYKLDELSKKANQIIAQILDQFEAKDQVVPVSFSLTSIRNKNSSKQSTQSC